MNLNRHNQSNLDNEQLEPSCKSQGIKVEDLDHNS